MERKIYIASELPVAGIAITFATREDALRAREVIPRGLTIKSLGRGLVANADMLRAFAEASIPVYRFVPPGSRLSGPLDINSIIAKIERIDPETSSG